MYPLRAHDTEAQLDSKNLGFQRMMEGLGEGFRDASDEILGLPGPKSPENADALWCRHPGGSEDYDRILFRAGTGVDIEPLLWEKHIDDFRDDSGEPLSDHDPVKVRFRLTKSIN